MMQLYRENILDHYKNPRNFETMESPDIEFNDSNPLCGDVITWHIKLARDKGNNDDAIETNIEQVTFTGEGCAISRAASSMLSDIVKGKSLNEISKIKPEEIFELLGVELSAMRIKCALLGLRALQKAILKNVEDIRS